MAAEDITDNPGRDEELLKVDEEGRITRLIRKPNGNLSLWQDDDLIHMSPELSEEITGALVRAVYGSLFLNPV